MHPILVEFGPLTIRWYGVFVALGFLLAFAMFRTRATRLSLEEEVSTNLALLLFVAGLVGARAWYVVTPFVRRRCARASVLANRDQRAAH